MTTPATPTAAPIHARWMVRRDLASCAEIEARCCRPPWDEETFLETLRQRNCIGTVATSPAGLVLGFTVHRLYPGKIEILRIAVDVPYQRQGLGRALVQRLADRWLADRLSPEPNRRRILTAVVPETNVNTQLFLRACGFWKTITMKDHVDIGTDAYLFEFFVG